jgi:hypothetical protein
MKTGGHVNRLIETTLPSVARALEDRIRRLEEQKVLMEEKLLKVGQPMSGFDDGLRTALNFLANPWNL